MRSRVVTACLAALVLVHAAAPRVARADDAPAAVDTETRDRSRAAFRKGVAQLRAQDWAAARASFETAWSLYPHPSILLNLGIARLKTDDPVRAEQDFVRFLSEDFGASPDELASAREALAEARTKLATLKVAVTPTTAHVTVDGKPVETVRRGGASGGGESLFAEVRAKPGRHTVAVEADGFTPTTRELDVAAKGEATVTVALAAAQSEPKPAPPPASATREIVGWSLVGLSGVALVTSGITALRAQSLSDDYADPSNAGFQQADTRSEGVAFRTTADVMLGVAVLAGAAGLVLLLTDLGKGSAAVSAARFGSPVLRW